MYKSASEMLEKDQGLRELMRLLKKHGITGVLKGKLRYGPNPGEVAFPVETLGRWGYSHNDREKT